MKQVFNKLVRDKIPEIIESNGEYALTKTLSDNEFNKALNQKLLEEVNEVINSKNNDELTEELADLLEVMYAKANANNIKFKDIEKVRIKKEEEKGSFKERIFLVHTVDQKYVDENKGCLTCANGSCRVPYDEKNGNENDGKPAGYYCNGFISCYTRSKK